MCNININQALNGIELSFDSKPAAATLDCIKAAGFRWNRATRVWYAKQTPERLEFARTLGEIATAAPVEVINLDGVCHKEKSCYGAEFAALIRSELKTRGVKGVTVKIGRGGYTDSITLTIKATPADLASVEEARLRFDKGDFMQTVNRGNAYDGSSCLSYSQYENMTDDERDAAYDRYIRYQLPRASFNSYHHDRRNDYWRMTTAFYNKVVAVFRIANQWNYDNSDIMTDYHDVGYYLGIDIKTPADFEPRENMTDDERAAYDDELRIAEEERAAAMEKYERERREAEEARKQYEKERAAVFDRVYNDIRVEDLDDDESLYVTGLIGGIGKEVNIDEIREEARAGQDAVINRRVIFTDESIYQDFGRFLIEEWLFVAGKGGTASEDVRFDDVSDYFKLTDKQRATVKLFNCNCVGVYVGDDLRLVIDPQGYNYPRYCYLADNATVMPAPAELERLKTESENMPAFYRPAPVKDQIKAIKEGDAITVYMTDGWILNAIEGPRGIVTAIYEGKYAQYDGVYIELSHGKKTARAFIRDGKDTMIFKGIKDALPAELTKRRISDNMSELLNAADIFPQLLTYYADAPVVDTIPR